MNLNSLYDFLEYVYPRMTKQQIIGLVTRTNIITVLNIIYIYIHLFFRITTLSPQEIIALICACLSPFSMGFTCFDMGLRTSLAWLFMSLAADVIFSEYISLWESGKIGLGSQVFCVIEGIFTLIFFAFIFSILYRAISGLIKLRSKTVPLLESVDPKNNAQVDTTPLHNPSLLYQEFGSPGSNNFPYGTHYYGV